MNSDNRPPVISIALVSTMALSYEILLMRLFSIIQWHHYAYMVISLALLGYGISGTVIAIIQQRLHKHFPMVYLLNLYLFGLSSVVCFLLVQLIPFNPEEMLWGGQQLLWLSLAYLTLSLPFFFAANAVALAMVHYRQSIARIYGYDLFGAGLGSLAIILLLFIVMPMNALYILGSLAMLITVLASWETMPDSKSVRAWLKSRNTRLVVVIVTASLSLWVVNKPDLYLSPYKGLSQTLRISGTQVVDEYSSPLGLISVVKNNKVPFRYAPGLSLLATQEPVPQLGIFIDGDGMTVLSQMPESIDRLAYMDQNTTALPYYLNRPEHVLILGGGTGGDVLQALLHNVRKIDVVELNPQLIKLVREDYGSFAGDIYNRDGVAVHTADARGFITGNKQSYDLIQLAMLDTYGSSGGGLYTLHENYLYTIEAIKLYLQHTNNTGYLSLSRWLSLPPRDSLKLFATVIETLHDAGIQNPAQHMLLIRSWQTGTLLVKKEPIDEREITALKAFCERNAFDVVYYPGIQPHESNRYNKLRQDDFYNGTQALLGKKREDYLAHYKFNLHPATDNRPYFFNFFKWSTLPEIIQLRERGGMPLLEAGYLVLIVVLLQAILISVILILLPNWFLLRHKMVSSTSISHSRTVIYFSALGLAFLFIEIAFIQKFILFLHHPLYAASIVLSSFLIFAGLGSSWAKRKLYKVQAKQFTSRAIAMIAIIAITYLLLLDNLFMGLIMLPLWAKLPVAIFIIAPLAFYMGIPFPSALTRLGDFAPECIPWAWGINGCASVISAVLATLIAIHAGFSIVIIVSVLLYLLASQTFPSPDLMEEREPGGS